MSNLRIDIKLFFGLYVVFILFTVIGTLSHEVGHYVVFKMFGYDARINYMSTIPIAEKDTSYYPFFRDAYAKYNYEITKDLDFPEKEKYLEIRNRQNKKSFWITLGGPLQTMFTGTIGFALLIAFRKKFIEEDKVHFAGWILIFLSLFWLRQLANLFTGFVGYLMKGERVIRSDETRLAYYLDINIWTIEVVAAIISALVLLYVLVKIIPRKLVLTFLLAGLLGGGSGYYLWLIKFGKIIMP